MASPLRVLIAGGGTGGHIYPALAIGDALRDGPGGAELLFLGATRGLESKLIPQAGYRLEMIEVGQLKGVSLAARARTLLDLPRGILRARALLREFRPGVVLSVGGYASGPAVAAALLAGIPTLAFEPNAAPGLANRLVGRRVTAAAINFPAAARWFHNPQVTGIPVRKGFFTLPPRPGGLPPHLLVFGGSQGARALNRVMPSVIAPLLDAVPGLTVLHQSGARAAEETLAAYQATGADPARWSVEPFLHDMPQRFAAADLVLCRSGASTAAELCAAAKPSLLVPFPVAADDHQRRNAEELQSAGAASVLLESDLTPATLLDRLRVLLADGAQRNAMGVRARSLAHGDAAQTIAGLARSLAVQSTLS